MLVLLSAAIVAQAGNQPAQATRAPEPSAIDKILANESYIKPPKEILDSVLAPWDENVSISSMDPQRERYINVQRPMMVPIAVMALPTKVLGGMEIDLEGNRSKDLVARAATTFDIINIRTGEKVRFVPSFKYGISTPEWSNNGKMVAFWGFHQDRTLLCVADAATGKIRVVTNDPGQPTLTTGLTWVDDDKAIVATFAPAGDRKFPAAPSVADRPTVRVSDQEKNALRTYQGLLNDEFDSQQFEHYAVSQLVRVNVGNGRVHRIGKPSAYRTVSAAPDGRAFWVTTIKRPFSYLVPFSSFGTTVHIVDEEGKELIPISTSNLRIPQAPATTPTTAPTPGGRGGQGGGAGQGNQRSTERRAMAWRPDGAGLSYLQWEAEDKDDADKVRKDRLMLWKYPFGPNDTEVVFSDTTAITSVQYTKNPRKIVVSQTKEGKALTTLVDLDETKNNKVLIDRPAGGGAAPAGRGPQGGGGQAQPAPDATGSLMQQAGPKTGSVIQLSDAEDAVFFSGTITAKDPKIESPRPWIDRLDLGTNVRTRIFESKAETYETAVGLDNNMTEMLVTRQSAVRVPNTYLVNRSTKEDRALTFNKDHNPELTQAERRTVVVTRQDGMKFEVVVTLPKGFKVGDKRPTFFWFYPSEFVDQATYDRSNATGNPNLFRRISVSSPLHFLKLGYVVVEPDCPIFNPADRKNDGYIPQLRNNLSATIDTLADEGLIDRKRLAIGGHSYGAFGTANAMAHTPYFKAGIAGDGAYNRLLTPFGFQSEQRMLWEAREVYLAMSPMLHAEQITGALLMYHGKEDQNMGTWPLNSERMFAALEALGKPSAMYMYPYEDHGQIAYETRLDMWARWVAWLQKWLEGK